MQRGNEREGRRKEGIMVWIQQSATFLIMGVGAFCVLLERCLRAPPCVCSAGQMKDPIRTTGLKRLTEKMGSRGSKCTQGYWIK
jgi:hypothetical protein